MEARQPGHLVVGRARQPYLSEETRALLPAGGTPSTPEQVLDRALRALAQEAGLLLDEGVVADPRDLDLCMITGAGWPFHLGGLTPLLDREGYQRAGDGRVSCRPGWRACPPEPGRRA